VLPAEGAKEFLDELRSLVQVSILSDSFEQFATPLLRQLGWPTLLCHRLVVENDALVDYKLRVPEQKQKAVAASSLAELLRHFGGGLVHDTAMLSEAHVGFLFRAPGDREEAIPQFKAVEAYATDEADQSGDGLRGVDPVVRSYGWSFLRRLYLDVEVAHSARRTPARAIRS